MKKSMVLMLALLTLLGLVAAGCGGDDDDDAGTDAATDSAGDGSASESSDEEGDETADEGGDASDPAGEGSGDDTTTAADDGSDDGSTASDYAMTITLDEPAEFAATYDLAQLDPGLSSYICFVGNGTGISLQLAGITGQALGFISINSSEGVIDGPGSLPVTGSLQTPEFEDLTYFEGEAVVESLDDVGSAGTFTLEAGDNSGKPPVSGSWSCGPA